EEEHEVRESARVAGRRVDLQEDAEDQPVDGDRRERVEQRPAPSQNRPLVLAAEFTEREIGEELAAPDVLLEPRHRRLTVAHTPVRTARSRRRSRRTI